MGFGFCLVFSKNVTTRKKGVLFGIREGDATEVIRALLEDVCVMLNSLVFMSQTAGFQSCSFTSLVCKKAVPHLEGCHQPKDASSDE